MCRAEWYFKDQHLSDTSKYSIEGMPNPSLTIINIDKTDAGEYICKSFNDDDVCTNSPAIQLEVKGNLQLQVLCKFQQPTMNNYFRKVFDAYYFSTSTFIMLMLLDHLYKRYLILIRQNVPYKFGVPVSIQCHY